jgi:phosphoribosylformylglycinamidine synthase subunit PurQ / glutaminase
MPMKPRALILLANGTNRDQDVAEALSLAGATPEIVPLNELRTGHKNWSDYQLLVLPGGFSYADALGAGKLMAIDMQAYFAGEIRKFVEAGKAVIGICNGFQALVKSGILPGEAPLAPEERGAGGERNVATLTFNAEGHFECRWVTLRPVSQNCVWTKALESTIECPIAHGEGNFQTITHSLSPNLIALTYVCEDGRAANGAYPANPNGSILDIAGITNPAGNVLGLMPHPENHIHPFQHPQWTRGVERGSGLLLFSNGVEYARTM